MEFQADRPAVSRRRLPGAAAATSGIPTAARPPLSRRRPVGRILLATDLGPTSSDAADLAIDLARQLGAELLIVSVIDAAPGLDDEPGPRARVDQVRNRREPVAQALVAQARQAGVAARFLIWHGDPSESIAAAADAEQCDLIVVGTHGRTGIQRSLAGSVSDYLIRNARCPVLVVRPGAPRAPQAARR